MRFVYFLLLFGLVCLNGIAANVVDDTSSVVKTISKEEQPSQKDKEKIQEYCSVSSSSAECNAEYNNNNNNNNNEEENVVTVVGVDSTNTEAVSNDNSDNSDDNDNNNNNNDDEQDENENDSDNDNDNDVEGGEDHDSDETEDSNDDDDNDDDENDDDNNNNEPQQPKEQKIQAIANTVFDNANIGLPMSFTPVIEEIDSKEKLFELIPEQSQQQKQQQKQQQPSNIRNHTEGGGVGGAFNNILLVIYDDECASELMSNPFFIAGYYNIGPGVFHTVRMKKSIYPKIIADWDLPATSCMHVLFIKKGSYYYDSYRFRRLSTNTPQGMAVFLEDQMGVEINVTNTLPFDVFLNWWGDEAEPVEVGYILAKQTSTQHTFLGHVFYTEDAVSRRLVNWFIVVGEGAVSVKASKYCEEENIVDADTCDKKFRDSFKSFVYEYWTRKREALNYVQRAVVKPVTEKGFLLMDLPDSLHESLVNFVQWSNEDNWWLVENQTGPVLNCEKSPSYLSHLGEEQREELEEWITPQIQQWSGIEDIDLQSIFGMRKYTKDAQIQMHVDPITSHLLSAIIFVKSSPPCETSDCEDWPIQILDNNDTLHEIVMKPGQVLFYESARDPCARIKPFSGESYITLYAHFKSQDEDDIHNYDWMFQEEILCSTSATSEAITETINITTVKK